MTPSPAGVFRILVVDDERAIHTVVGDALESYSSQVQIDWASDADEATSLMSESLYDLALLDLLGKDELQIGTEVYRRIDAQNLSTRVLFMTKYNLKEDARRLLELTGSPSSWRLIGFLDKQTQFDGAVKDQVGHRIEAFRKTEASIDGLDSVVQQIKRKRGRYKSDDGVVSLRANRSEIAAEVDRLIRKLYVELPGRGDRKSRVSVTLEAMDRRGLSSAVVANAKVTVRFADIDHAVGGQTTALKIGPKAEIFEEAARFSEYVRFGVKLKQRVELLGVAGADALGGLVYSFAGGQYGNELLPLDQVLLYDLNSGDLSSSTSVLESLFATTDWYSVGADPEDVSDYFRRNYSTNLPRSSGAGDKYLLDLGRAHHETGPWVERIDEAKPSYLKVTTSTGSNIVIPDASVLGWGQLLYRAPACLVHGDMHGGNVLLEASIERKGLGSPSVTEHLRTCLIDFRNSGPGPRCIDAVCLESTIRLADAESAIIAGAVPGSRGSSASLPTAIANQMLDRFEDEKALYQAIFLGHGTVPNTSWAKLCETVLLGVIRVFDGVSLREYLATSVRYTIRSLGFPLNEVARYRMVAWLGAQYQLASELED